MGKYIQHLQQLSRADTFKRKKDYIDFNLKKYFEQIGFKKINVLEVGPGLGEFESYLNDKKVINIDILDNDKNVLEYVSKKFKVRNKFLEKNIVSVSKKLKSYDLIFLMQVLEHLPVNHYVPALKMLYIHLKLNGYLVIVVPNGNNPLGLIERYADLQHTNCFTGQSLRDVVNLSGIKNYEMEIRGYEIPPYDLINLVRIVLQKILHFMLLIVMIVNGGLFFKTMTPNIMLVLRKR